MMIERHILKLNVFSKGYCLYIKENDIFEENEINVTNERVPQTVVSIQKNIERILFSNKLPVSLSFNYDRLRKKLLIGFGILLYIPDDKNREGIVYIHCIELNDTNLLFSLVLQIIKTLSISNINNIYQKILRSLANENKEVLPSLKLLCNQIDDYKYISLNFNNNANIKNIYSKITHDCSGGSSIAWLTFSFQLTNNNANWEVFDIIEKDGIISTTLNPINKVNVTTSSELLIIFQETNLFSNLHNSEIETEENFKKNISDNSDSYMTEIATNSKPPEFKSDDNVQKLTKEINGNDKTEEKYTQYIDGKDKPPKFKKRINIKSINLKSLFRLSIFIAFFVYVCFDVLTMYELKNEVAILKVNVHNDSIKIKNIKTNHNTNAISETTLKTIPKHSSEIIIGQKFIRSILTSINGIGDKLTKNELEKALPFYVKSDSLFMKDITFLIESFDSFDKDKNSKLDSIEIEKALNKVIDEN